VLTSGADRSLLGCIEFGRILYKNVQLYNSLLLQII